MPERRDPYIWVTWITRYLSGDDHCLWKGWFKAHHADYIRVPDTFDLAKWKADHGEMVRRRVEDLKGRGYDVYIEGQNSFKVQGSNGAILAGKPDNIAVEEGAVRVVDCKTGSRRDSDQFQVLLYMMMLPYDHPVCRDANLIGEVAYQDGSVEIPADELDDDLKDRVKQVLHIVGAVDPPDRVASYGECSWCNISAEDCPDRIETEPEASVTDAF